MALAPKPRRSRHAATLADVGREAGVSAMAASAVLNGARTSSRISDETRERILTVAKRLNYRPNAAARALADRRMNTIGVATLLSAQELNQYFLEVFNGVIEGAALAGQNTTVFAIPNWDEGATRLPAICDGRIDGLILLAPWLSLEQAKFLPDHTPFVSIHANVDLPGVTNIESDEEAGAFEMVRHMISLGHRRIMHLSGSRLFIGARRRIEGYLRAHEVAGVTPDPDLLVEADFSAAKGRTVMENWIQSHRGRALPEAIFCANDALAIGCLEALSAHRIRTPEDVSVVGFDDTLIARSTHLATVRQPLHLMGQRAVEILVSKIEAKHNDATLKPARNLIFPTEIVPGHSLASPRATPYLLR